MGLFGKARDSRKNIKPEIEKPKDDLFDDVLSDKKEEKEYIQARNIFEAPPQIRVNDIVERFVLNDSVFTDEVEGLDYAELSIVYNSINAILEKADESDENVPKFEEKRDKVLEIAAERVNDATLNFICTEKTHTPFRLEVDTILAYIDDIRAKEVKKYLEENNSEQGPFYIVPAKKNSDELKKMYNQGAKYIAVEGSRLKIETRTLIEEDIEMPRNANAVTKMQYFMQRMPILGDEDRAKCNYTMIIDLANTGKSNFVPISWVDEEKKGEGPFRARCIKDSNGNKWAVLFTDRDAAASFFKDHTDYLEESLENCYLATIKNSTDIAGIAVNPGREGLSITRLMMDTYFRPESFKSIIDKHDKFFLIMSNVYGGLYPAVDAKGNTFLYTNRVDADNMVETNKELNLFVKEYSKDEFIAVMRTWYPLGIVRILINGRINATRDDYFEDSKVKGTGYSGSSLVNTLIRYSQVAPIPRDEYRAMALTYWSAASHTIKETLFVVPMMYQGEQEKHVRKDRCFHFTEGAMKIYQNALDSEKPYPPFYGGEEYKPLTVLSDNKKMTFRTVRNGDKEFVPLYTDVASMRSMFGENARVAIVTYDELLPEMEKISGGVINPGGVSFALVAQVRESLEKMAKDKVKLFVADKNAAAGEKTEASDTTEE